MAGGGELFTNTEFDTIKNLESIRDDFSIEIAFFKQYLMAGFYYYLSLFVKQTIFQFVIHYKL